VYRYLKKTKPKKKQPPKKTTTRIKALYCAEFSPQGEDETKVN